MRSEAFLVFTRAGVEKLTKTKPPRLAAGQYAVRLVLVVPDGLFAPPIPTATLEVPESASLAPQPTVSLDAMEEICSVQVGVAFQTGAGGHTYRCTSCGFQSWRKDFGTHYKPAPELEGDEEAVVA